MIDHHAYDAAERQRAQQIIDQIQADNFAGLQVKFDALVRNRGVAYLSENLGWMVRMFPPQFLHQQIRIEGRGTPYQRVQLRRDLVEAA